MKKQSTEEKIKSDSKKINDQNREVDFVIYCKEKRFVDKKGQERKTSMKKCPVCGKEWSDATRFCGSCGAKLEDGNIVVPDIVPDDGKEEQRKKTEPVKPSVKKTIEPVRTKTRETAENKKIAEEKEEEKNTAERKRAEYNKSDAVLPVKRKKKMMENCDALGLTAIVAVGAVVFCVKSGENMEHPFVELYGDSYEILTKEKLGHTITITDNGLDW